MESPLDMLSRAASMIDSDRRNRELADFHQEESQRTSPPKELPTKLLKFRRIKDRQQLISPGMLQERQTANNNNNNSHTKRCTGTQTSFSSFREGAGPVTTEYPTMYPSHMQSSDSYNILDLDKAKALPAMSYPAYKSSPLLPSGGSVQYDSRDSNSSPLNLTLTAVQSNQTQTQQLRPSVITVAPPTSRFQNMMESELRLQVPFQEDPSAVDICDPAIEEHFRRSLGKNYPGYQQPAPISPPPLVIAPTPMVPHPKAMPKSPTAPAPPMTEVNQAPAATKNAVSITGAVDDHFAKSLGDTWRQIKAQESMQLDIFTGSVDDHFAKALGDTWLRLKSKQNTSPATTSPQPMLHT